MRAPPRRHARAILAGAALLPPTLVLSACGAVDITPQRIESSLGTVFANYYVQQQAMLGHPPITTASLGARTSCDRGGPNNPDKGAGSDWLCYLDWTDAAGVHYTDADPNHPASKLELKVASNACYIAVGPSRAIGPIQIQGPDGKYFNNPVFEFDGCFDVSDDQTSLTRATLPTVSPPCPPQTAAPIPTAAPTAAPTPPTPTSTPSPLPPWLAYRPATPAAGSAPAGTATAAPACTYPPAVTPTDTPSPTPSTAPISPTPQVPTPTP